MFNLQSQSKQECRLLLENNPKNSYPEIGEEFTKGFCLSEMDVSNFPDWDQSLMSLSYGYEESNAEVGAIYSPKEFPL